jgi:PadR family transcriptional regulator, regulatory protein PadR
MSFLNYLDKINHTLYYIPHDAKYLIIGGVLMGLDKEMLKGYMDIIFLSLLQEQPLYGYELAKKAREVSGAVFDIKEATLYMALKRLEKQGLLISFWGNPDEGSAGRRKYYRLTDEGMTHLLNGKRDWDAFKMVIEQFLGGVRA